CFLIPKLLDFCFRKKKRDFRIIELSLLAVDRKEFNSDNENVRVINKLNLCFRPRCHISPEAAKAADLTDSLLQFQQTFENSAELIKLFLRRLNKPICILAYSDDKFDFPLLRTEFNNSQVDISGLMLCAYIKPVFKRFLREIPMKTKSPSVRNEEFDQTGSPSAKNEESYQIEYLTDDLTNVHLDNKCNNDKDDNIVKDNIDFLKSSSSNEICKNSADMRQISEDQKLCETKSPVKEPLFTNSPDVKQNTCVDKKTPLKIKVKISDEFRSLYNYFFNCPLPDSRTAEGDALALLKMAKKVNDQFLTWLEENIIPFDSIPIIND
ncbi:uncharacterized protein LOC111612877, partial [Centruroides sculpturatus]|uniref:uncharacterized protein LOC111612877 n=1 Tax=Centruroides sculpturatus TaxID=218467 RepID=UPI000C6D75C6